MSETQKALATVTSVAVAVQFQQAPTSHKYRVDLTPVAGRKVDEWTRLIPINDCRQIISELDGLLIAAGTETATRQAEILIGSYPAREMADPTIFIRGIASIFSETPKDIGQVAVDQLTRACKWLPTRSEVAMVCGDMVNARRAALRIAYDQLEEHRKRGKEKDTAVRYTDLTEKQKSDFDKTISSSIRSMS
tara:strand:- start:56 stop:631 length:576 start_codon:yes stop_codon:yes gene_type:complete